MSLYYRNYKYSITKIIYILAILSLLFSPFSASARGSEKSTFQVDTPTETICVDFSQLPAGTTVEGMGTVEPTLNITTSTGNGIVVKENEDPFAYASYGRVNHGLETTGGFTDADKIHNYIFSFAPGVAVSQFSIKMLDYGDYNPVGAIQHEVALTAYNSDNIEINQDVFTFQSDGHIDETDELWTTGDASAPEGNPGNYTYSVSGTGITRVELRLSSNLGNGATDPFFALTALCYTTETPPPVPPSTVCADFAQIPTGTSVEGLGTLNPSLNITSSTGNAVAMAENMDPFAYRSRFGVTNYGMGALGGFADADHVHDYTFTFAPDVTVSQFDIKMLDYGDYNPVGATQHDVALVAYDAAGNEIGRDTLSFQSDGFIDETDELWITGDSTAPEGSPGNFTFSINATGITRLNLEFSSNLGNGVTDPFFGLAVLCFTPEETPPPPASTCVDFNQVATGSSVEGFGTLTPNLNISSSTGNAVAMAENMDPFAYRSRFGVTNYGMGALGGFADADHVHDYTFTFAPDVTVSQFDIKMLDYGDYNPVGATQHDVALVAYDAAGNEIGRDTLSFQSDGFIDETDELWITGDSTAPEGSPGNFTFSINTSGIARTSLEFSSNIGGGPTDPFFGLAVLCFTPEAPPPPTDTPQTCEDLGYTTIAEDSWTEHVIRGMDPITLGYARPSAADYAIVNTGWEWTGLPGQNQTTEMHSVVTPFGTVTSQDYGDEELEGQILWFGAPQGAFDQPSLQVTIDYAGDGSQPDSHRSHGRIAWCDNPNIDPPPPNQPLTCEDIGLEPVATANWSQHVIYNMTPVTENFAQPDDANYVIVNTAWAWSGLPDQHQVTEKHSVDTPLGTAVSDDYGDAELEGELIWYDVLQGAFGSGNLPVTIDYAGDGSDPGSHFSKGMVDWCRDPNAPDASSTLLQPLGDNGAQVEVAFTCSAAAPTLISATMNGYTVEDGQVLWLVPHDDSFSNTVDGNMTAIYGPSFSLAVTCADADGNQSTTIVVPDLGSE